MQRCATCDATMESEEGFRQHYGSDYHIANVRRKVEGLRALTVAEYARVNQTQVDKAEATGVDANGVVFYSCTLCKKTFRSVQTLQTHVRSTAHLMRKEQRIITRDSEAASMLTMTSLGSAAMGLHRRHNAKRSAAKKSEVRKRTDAPKVSAEHREADTSETRCLFCGHGSASAGANLTHMDKFHNFNIPMEDHCPNKPVLVDYLARKVNGLMCLVCSEKTRSFASLEALRAHMYEAGHERVVLSPEYQEFYDCPLEDPGNAKRVELDGLQADGTELVLAGKARGRAANEDRQKKRVLLKREAEVPRVRARETPEQAQKRLAILNSEHKALTIAKQEQRELMAERNKDQAKLVTRYEGEFNKQQMRVHLRSNKLHPKGYDGDGVMN